MIADFIAKQPWGAIPAVHRRNFLHLYFDIGWAGVATGSLLTFTSIYLTRIGATTAQLGWFTAIPAIVALGFALPVGWWLKEKEANQAVFWSAFAYRLFYFVWLPLPVWLGATAQIHSALTLTWMMSIPGTVLVISFNALFASAVPPEWRNRVIGIRHGVLALTSITTALLCGAILERLPFPSGYQLAFAIGAVAGNMSTLHLWFVRDLGKPPSRPERSQRITRDFGRSGRLAAFRETLPVVPWRYMLRRRQLRWPGVDILQGDYGRIMGLVFFLF